MAGTGEGGESERKAVKLIETRHTWAANSQIEIEIPNEMLQNVNKARIYCGH